MSNELDRNAIYVMIHLTYTHTHERARYVCVAVAYKLQIFPTRHCISLGWVEFCFVCVLCHSVRAHAFVETSGHAWRRAHGRMTDTNDKIKFLKNEMTKWKSGKCENEFPRRNLIKCVMWTYSRGQSLSFCTNTHTRTCTCAHTHNITECDAKRLAPFQVN